MAFEDSTVIEDVRARKILDSRGNPTIEVDVATWGGFGRASAPGGASVGAFEVKALPDGGLDKAIRQVEELIAPELIGMDADDQAAIDKTLHEIDNTSNFSFIGGSAAIATSIAVAKAASSSKGIPLYQHIGGCMASRLPIPLGNVLGGGRHVYEGADVQEVLILPMKARSMVDAVEANLAVHKALPKLIKRIDGGFVGGRGDEGAWAASLKTLELLKLAKEACGVVEGRLGVTMRIGLDLAASSLWDRGEGRYVYRRDGVERTPEEQLEFILGLIDEFGLAYVEDPFHEEDLDSFAELTRKAPKCLICGDDLYATNKERLLKGAARGACNSLIIKPNQVGTLTDTYETIMASREHGYMPVISHRSGETVDEALAHLAVAFQCPIIKTGVVGGERLAKLNELIRIWESIGERAEMAKLKLQA